MEMEKILLIFIVWVVFMFLRNCQVYFFKMNIINIIDLSEQDNFWKLNALMELETVSYETILFKCWKPLTIESFFPDSKYLKQL